MNYLQFLTENYIIPEKNFEININEWRCGNPLWITGSSGDGKSTLANQIAIENNAYLIHTDLFLGRICRPKEKYEKMLKSTNGTINSNGSEMVLEYINKHPELPWMVDFRETGKLWNDFFDWILYNAKNNIKYRNKLIIIEGCDICLMPSKKAAKLPLIIVGTSRLQASFRRIKRDQEDGKHTLIENIFRELKRHRAFIHELDTNKDNFEKGVKSYLNEEYERPYSMEEIRKNYGEDYYNKLKNDPIHRWRAETGIELIHREPSKEELERIMKNWESMDDRRKRISDKKSMEVFGCSNKDNYNKLIKAYNETNLDTLIFSPESIIQKKVTLYHGSPDYYKVLKPTGINFGNRLEKPSWSIFCFTDFKVAKNWAAFRTLNNLNRQYYAKTGIKVGRHLTFDSFENIGQCRKESFDDICNILIGNKKIKFYVYEFKAPINKIGLGNDSTHDEYTYNEEVKNYKLHTFILNKNNVKDYLIPRSDEELEMVEINTKKHSHRGLATLLYDRDYSGQDREMINAIFRDKKISPGDDIESWMKENNYKFNKTTRIPGYGYLNENKEVNYLIPFEYIYYKLFISDNKYLLNYMYIKNLKLENSILYKKSFEKNLNKLWSMYLNECQNKKLKPTDKNLFIDTLNYLAIYKYNSDFVSKKEEINAFKEIIKQNRKYGDKTVYSNKYINTYDETLETRLTKPFLSKNITLYRGDINKYSIVDPKQGMINIGTKLSSPRYSSWWCKDIFLPCMISYGRVFRDYFYENVFNKDKKQYYKNIDKYFLVDYINQKVYINEEFKDKIPKNITRGYLYEVTVPTKLVGRGHNIEIEEFTLDFPIKPDKILKVKYSMIEPYIEWISKEDLIIKHNKLKGNRYTHNPNFIEKLVYYDTDEMRKRRKKYKKLNK